MYLTMLSSTDIDYGTRVTETLRESNLPFNGSLWIFNASAAEWRLMIATPLVDKIGATATYRRVLGALKDVQDDSLTSKLWVVSPKKGLYKKLRDAFGKTKDVTGMRISHSTVDGVSIEDSYFYQVH